MRSWGVFQRIDLTQWLRGHGFAGTQPGNHITARAQGHFFQETCWVDARVALLEAFFVRLTLHLSRSTAVPMGAVATAKADDWQ